MAEIEIELRVFYWVKVVERKCYSVEAERRSDNAFVLATKPKQPNNLANSLHNLDVSSIFDFEAFMQFASDVCMMI